jgi:hypothetical protein
VSSRKEYLPGKLLKHFAQVMTFFSHFHEIHFYHFIYNLIDNLGQPKVKVLVHGIENALERHKRLKLLRFELQANKIHFQMKTEHIILNT